jgi:hypothetical protein
MHRLAVLLAALSLPAAASAARCPNLVIVLDKSGSMLDGPDGRPAPRGQRRWDLAVAAVEEILKRYDGQLPIGLSLFASDAGCAAGKLEVPPEYDSAKKITDRIALVRDPDSATPTSETINSLRGEKVLRDPARGQYLLLITDGEPTCSFNEPQATVDALSAACKQMPPIHTFVVGFGALPASAADAMDKMAVAGCRPAMGRERKFYAAESLEALTNALDEIFRIIVPEGMSGCDDSCYSPEVGCPNPGEMCIRGECRANPCAGVSCGPGQYCYTNGVSPAMCVKACTMRCPAEKRCELGQCIKDPCGVACPAGQVCNPASRFCEPDPLCPADRPKREQCKRPSECQFGKCVDDPCQFITCPRDTRCVVWNGSCEYVGGPRPAADMGGTDITEQPSRGCSFGLGAAAQGSAAAVLVLALLFGRLARRRRR